MYSNDKFGVLFDKNKTELIQYPKGNIRTSYEIPESVTRIGEYAFYDCGSLTNVTIGNGVTSIGFKAFAYCVSLTSMTIPESVTRIGDDVFYYCTGLTSIIITESITNIGNYAFYYCTSLTSVSIPDSVTGIGSYAFASCHNLTSIEIPNSVTNIGEVAFYCCGLESIKIGKGITTLKSHTFAGCFLLKNLIVPETLKFISANTFYLSKIENIYYSGSKSDWEQIIVGANNDGLTSAKIHYNSTGPADDDSAETPEVPDNIPDYDFSVVDTYLMPTPTQTTISYGDSIVLHIDPSKIPTGGKAEWYPSNGNFSYSVSADGTTCTITPKNSGNTNFTATIYDADGKPVLTDKQSMTSKAGLFDKIIAFFKNLFGLTKTIPEAFNGIY